MRWDRRVRNVAEKRLWNARLRVDEVVACTRGAHAANGHGAGPALWSLQIDHVGDDLEVLHVEGQKRYALDVRGRGDGQIQRAPAWLPAATGHGSVQSPALTRGDGIERDRIEVRLNRAQPKHAVSSRRLVARHKHTEVQLRQRHNAYR